MMILRNFIFLLFLSAHSFGAEEVPDKEQLNFLSPFKDELRESMKKTDPNQSTLANAFILSRMGDSDGDKYLEKYLTTPRISLSTLVPILKHFAQMKKLDSPSFIASLKEGLANQKKKYPTYLGLAHDRKLRSAFVNAKENVVDKKKDNVARVMDLFELTLKGDKKALEELRGVGGEADVSSARKWALYFLNSIQDPEAKKLLFDTINKDMFLVGHISQDEKDILFMGAVFNDKKSLKELSKILNYSILASPFSGINLPYYTDRAIWDNYIPSDDNEFSKEFVQKKNFLTLYCNYKSIQPNIVTNFQVDFWAFLLQFLNPKFLPVSSCFGELTAKEQLLEPNLSFNTKCSNLVDDLFKIMSPYCLEKSGALCFALNKTLAESAVEGGETFDKAMADYLLQIQKNIPSQAPLDLYELAQLTAGKYENDSQKKKRLGALLFSIMAFSKRDTVSNIFLSELEKMKDEKRLNFWSSNGFITLWHALRGGGMIQQHLGKYGIKEHKNKEGSAGFYHYVAGFATGCELAKRGHKSNEASWGGMVTGAAYEMLDFASHLSIDSNKKMLPVYKQNFEADTAAHRDGALFGAKECE